MKLASTLSLCATVTLVALTTVPECAVDLNKDGKAGVEDLFRYITAFLASDPVADMDKNGDVGKDDLAMFLEGFFVGCR